MQGATVVELGKDCQHRKTFIIEQLMGLSCRSNGNVKLLSENTLRPRLLHIVQQLLCNYVVMYVPPV
jgi:hypothetical protein